MLPQKVRDALSGLTQAFADNPDVEPAVVARWRAGSRRAGATSHADVSEDVRRLADTLSTELPAFTHHEAGSVALGEVLGGADARALFAWCSASTWRRDINLAPVLEAAARAFPEDQLVPVARARVVEGPLLDALSCVPLLGDGSQLLSVENQEAIARLEILIWEAGASALELPDLGRWIWGSATTFEAMVEQPAHSTLMGRVLAARCLEVSARGMPDTTDPSLVGRTLQVLQPLLLHPEPLVWVHAARALGRLTGAFEQLENTILDWVLGESRVLRQRAMTAFASLPAERLRFLASQLVAIVESPAEEAWVLAAVAAATPYLFFERRVVWDRLTKRILAGDGGAIAARALARGLATLWRRGSRDLEVERVFRVLRDMAREARPDSLEELRRWIEVVAITDVVEAAERDPLDLELGIENLVRIAAQYDDAEADARASRFASSLAATFQEARRIALSAGRPRSRAAAINAIEGCARTFALRLWEPMLATCDAQEMIDPPDLGSTWEMLSKAPAELLDIVKARRHGDAPDGAMELALETLAIKLGGYALDACGFEADRGATAHDTCRWLRKIEGLADGSRELPTALKTGMSSLFWRLVDTTRGTALGEVDDVRWLGPFAAWWALVIDRPAMLYQLATALPLMAESALRQCVEQAEKLRTALASNTKDGDWKTTALAALGSLHAEDTELALALGGLADALAGFASAAGPKKELEAMSLELVTAGDRLQNALANPVRALHPTSADAQAAANTATENAPRVAALVARAIRARDLAMLDVWLASLGPIASTLLETAVSAAIKRTPPPPPVKKKEPTTIEGYELVKPLGEGGIGSVWLVRKPGADRLFVLKIPKADALASANEIEREGILASFVEEARALAGLYHPNVANIIDRGVSGGVPFLVLEYLIGADLKQYSTARPMTLFELKHVVVESCAGLAALHGAGLVHRDLKPANIWLRLPLAGGERFDGPKHRDPATTPPLAAVVIDFGMVRATRVSPDVCGRFVAGTAGYIAPEQVLDPVELDVRSDVYALAGTIYNVTTGRAFFDDIESLRDRMIAHMRKDPFEDAERLRAFPSAMAKLLRAATALAPGDRPMPLEFGREFVAAL
ncbi:MAG: serine/threonine protein kinase [Polyangiaceae bacterium]|nr:serine/threonine protein kinase [Polyangiaceae bacterium]